MSEGGSAAPGAGQPLQLWGGVECSNVRIGDTWRDQVRETGHHDRGPADIRRLAGLGLRRLRYPLLWERHRPESAPDQAWHDRQLAALQQHGIAVIGGLLHHGAGPAETNLLDPGLGEKLAGHAARMAGRYPWIDTWTPVNEPLTTARFACLYGHWHPHARDEGMFFHAVVNQCRAVLLAMRAIRAVRPDARFLHTEDIGRIFATDPLADQASYENDRRWLSLDLLCGRVSEAHPWRGYLQSHGVSAAHLDELATGDAMPDLIGVNHYATSDRFLDHRVHLYAEGLHGGNGRLDYADVEAARVDLPPDATGWAPRLREVWARYGRPMVLSEVHLGCDDPDEPVRWLMEAWSAALAIRAEGADIRAVTPWSLLGSVDWDSMLALHRGRAEAGAWDMRSDPPRETRLASAIRALARDSAFHHPLLGQPGWWKRSDRLLSPLQPAVPV